MGRLGMELKELTVLRDHLGEVIRHTEAARAETLA